ncbi:hypothetical protein G3A43_36200 [Paraburkholderia aspalathi]|nr:hypothetical protein [Paraburkholderia aspalathi]MBK3785673.1 hypothetical protein [Paraburkholderia aspalathi]
MEDQAAGAVLPRRTSGGADSGRVTVTGSFPLEDIWTVNFREAGPLTASSTREDFVCMTIVFRRLEAIFLDSTARFISVDPRMSNQDRLFLSGHGLDTIREIAQQFPRDGQLGVRMAELQRSREFARALMDFVDPEMSFGDFIRGVNQAFASWHSELDRTQPCRAELAAAMRRELFAGNDAGWRAYAAHMRTHLSWFAGDEALRIPDKTRKTSGKVVSDAVAGRKH